MLNVKLTYFDLFVAITPKFFPQKFAKRKHDLLCQHVTDDCLRLCTLCLFSVAIKKSNVLPKSKL